MSTQNLAHRPWTKHVWPAQTFTDFMLVGTPWFIARPDHNSHARAIGMPDDRRYALYESGAHPSGCAALRGFYRTLKLAKAAAIEKASAQCVP